VSRRVADFARAATPLDFLDARTAVGTLPTRDGAYLRLVVESATGAVRELTRLPADAEPQFAAATAVSDDLVWAQTADGRQWQIWTASRAAGKARRLVADAGDVLLGGGQYDLDWCQVMVLTARGDLVRVDLMHPDGSAPRQIAGPGARSAVDDVAVPRHRSPAGGACHGTTTSRLPRRSVRCQAASISLRGTFTTSKVSSSACVQVTTWLYTSCMVCGSSPLAAP
jgi:hypothetical protein